MLNQETIIKLAVQHGFKVGRDAGGEYVAPKYEDAVGSLVALVQAAYALGQQAPAVAVTDGWRDAATSALRFIEANTEHDQRCEVLDLDENGCHKGCTCGMEDAVKKLRAMLDAAQKGGA